MRYGRGPDGFRVVVPTTISQLVEATEKQSPGTKRAWDAVVARLRFTAMSGETVQVEGRTENWRLFVSLPDLEAGYPKITAVMHVQADMLTFKQVLIEPVKVKKAAE